MLQFTDEIRLVVCYKTH